MTIILQKTYILKYSLLGAILGGKLAAEVIANRAIGSSHMNVMKNISPDVIDKAKDHIPKEPVGVKGDGAIAWGGGAVLSK